LINEERWLLIDKFLHKFPLELLHHDPQLLALAGWRHLAQMRLDQVEKTRHSLAAELEKSEFPPDVALFLRSSCQLFRAVKNNWDGNFEDVRVDSQAVLSAVPYEWSLMRSYAWLYLATAVYFLQGEPAAVKVLQSAEADDWEDSVLLRIRKKISFSVVYLQSSNLTMLLQEGEQGLKLIQNHAESAYTSASSLHFYIGSAYYLQNKLELATEHFTAVMEKRYVSQSYMVVLSAIGLALVHQAQNQEEAARQVMDTTVAYCLEMEHPQMVLVARAFQAELAWRQGQMVQATHWASQAISMPVPKVIPFTFHPFLTLCKILLADDTPTSRQQAETVLTQLSELAFSTYTIRLQIEALAMQALLYQSQGKTSAAHTAVKEAIQLAEPAGIIRPFVDLGPKMADLLEQVYRVGQRPLFIQQLLDAFPATAVPPVIVQQPLIESLTDREMDVLNLLAQRLSNKEIAQELVIAPETVKRHTINIYQKLGVESRRQAVVQAYTIGLLK
jgi:LuxR family maltose regulon positive regulatory protein